MNHHPRITVAARNQASNVIFPKAAPFEADTPDFGKPSLNDNAQPQPPSLMGFGRIEDCPAALDYIRRNGAIKINPFSYAIPFDPELDAAPENEAEGGYHRGRTEFVFRFTVDGKIVTSLPEGADMDDDRQPSKEERAGWAAFCKEHTQTVTAWWPHSRAVTVAESEAQRRAVGAEPENWFPLRNPMDRSKIAMIQERRDGKQGGKSYRYWSFWESPTCESGWLAKEGDNPNGVPPWVPAQRPVADLAVMIHEGPKAARFIETLLHNPKWKDWCTFASFWTKYLQRFEHWGTAVGAHNPWRCDLTGLVSIARAGNLNEVVVVVDNDEPGIESMKAMARKIKSLNLPKKVQVRFIRFTGEYRYRFDLADIIETWYVDSEGNALFDPRETDNEERLPLPPLTDYVLSGTWATEEIPPPKREPGTRGAKPKLKYRLTKECCREWVYIPMYEVVAHVETRKFYTEKVWNNMMMPFSDVHNTIDLLKKANFHTADALGYLPGSKADIYTENGTHYFNLWLPTPLTVMPGRIEGVPLTEAEIIAMAAPFIQYLDHLIIDSNDRDNYLRWMVTMTACPERRMRFSYLFRSEMQGVGKTIMATILRKMVGHRNARFVSEKDLKSEFTAWKCGVRLLLVSEIKSENGASFYKDLMELISNSTTTVRLMYTNPFEYPNRLHLFMNSNEVRPIKIPAADRRIEVPEVQNTHSWPQWTDETPEGWLRCNSHNEYWKTFIPWLEQHDGYRIIYTYLLMLARRPEMIVLGSEWAKPSATKDEMINEGRSPMERFAWKVGKIAKAFEEATFYGVKESPTRNDGKYSRPFFVWHEARGKDGNVVWEMPNKPTGINEQQTRIIQCGIVLDAVEVYEAALNEHRKRFADRRMEREPHKATKKEVRDVLKRAQLQWLGRLTIKGFDHDYYGTESVAATRPEHEAEQKAWLQGLGRFDPMGLPGLEVES